MPNSEIQSNSAQTIRPQNQLPTTSTLSARNPSSELTNQGQPTPSDPVTQPPFVIGDVDDTTISDNRRPSDQLGSVVPPTIASTTPPAYTPFACIARLVPTLDRVPAGKKSIILRVSVTEGTPRDSWWRLYFGQEIISGGLTFDSDGYSESSKLIVDAGSTIYAEVFASSQYLSNSIACEAKTAVAP